MINKLTSSERLFWALLIPLLGVGLLFFSIKNIYRDLRLLNSPLDQSSESAGVKSSQSGKWIPEQNSEFLPVLAPQGSAPEMDSPFSDPEIRFQDFQVRLAVQGKDSVRDASFTSPILAPERLVIESLDVDHRIAPVASREVEYLGAAYQQWTAPNSGELGWHDTSAKLGAVGNTVINGHSSGYGETFRDLEDLKNGDLIQVYAENVLYTYVVANTMILKERWEPIEVRMENARWINPSRDERLTLISCWPDNSNTHRVVVVAKPYSVEELSPAMVLDSAVQIQNLR